MATFVDQTALKNITEYPNSFQRQGSFPLERYSIFKSEAEMKEYAKSNPVAYVGQFVAVFDGTNPATGWLIINEAGDVVQLAQGGDLSSVLTTIQAMQTSITALQDHAVVYRAAE